MLICEPKSKIKAKIFENSSIPTFCSKFMLAFIFGFVGGGLVLQRYSMLEIAFSSLVQPKSVML